MQRTIPPKSGQESLTPEGEKLTPEREKELLDRKETIDEWSKFCMRQHYAKVQSQMLGSDFSASQFVIVDDLTKSPMEYYKGIIKEFRGTENHNREPGAHLGRVTTVRPLQDKIKGPHVMIKVPFEGISSEEFIALEALDKGTQADQNKLANILAKAPHYYLDEKGNISKIPPPQVRFRWELPGKLDAISRLSETTGKKQSIIHAAAFIAGVVGAVVAVPPLALALPVILPIAANYAGNSFEEIIAGHGESMREMKMLNGITSIGISWEGNPHKEVLWGMLLEAEKEGLSVDLERVDPKVMAFINGQPFTQNGPHGPETFKGLSVKDSEKFRAKIRQLKVNKVKFQIYANTQEKPIFEKDEAALNAKENLRLEEEFKGAKEKFPKEDDPYAAALKAKYDDMKVTEEGEGLDKKIAQLLNDATEVAKRTEFLKDTGTELEESRSSYEYLLAKPEDLRDAPPIPSSEKGRWEKFKDYFKDVSERAKDPLKALDLIQDRFKDSSREMGSLTDARENEAKDLVRRNEKIKEQLQILKDGLTDKVQLEKVTEALAKTHQTGELLEGEVEKNKNVREIISNLPTQIEDRKKQIALNTGRTYTPSQTEADREQPGVETGKSFKPQ